MEISVSCCAAVAFLLSRLWSQWGLLRDSAALLGFPGSEVSLCHTTALADLLLWALCWSFPEALLLFLSLHTACRLHPANFW